MSGGSWDYFFRKLHDVAESLETDTSLEGSMLDLSDEAKKERARLGTLLREAAKAMHAIEWADSHDSAPDSEIEHIRNVFALAVKLGTPTEKA